MNGHIFDWIAETLKLCVKLRPDKSCLHILLHSSNIRSLIYLFAFFTIYGYIINSQSVKLPHSLIAQSVEHSIGIAEVMGSNLVKV